MFMWNIFGQLVVYAADEVVKNVEKSKATKKLEKVEEVVTKVAEKIKNKTHDNEIKKQLEEKKEEIKKVTEQAKKEIENAKDTRQINEIEEKTKKVVVLKLVNWLTKKEDVKEKIEETVKTESVPKKCVRKKIKNKAGKVIIFLLFIY